jgi:hypothetical protein
MPGADAGCRRQAAPINNEAASNRSRLRVVVTGDPTGQFVGRRKKAVFCEFRRGKPYPPGHDRLLSQSIG